MPGVLPLMCAKVRTMVWVPAEPLAKSTRQGMKSISCQFWRLLAYKLFVSPLFWPSKLMPPAQAVELADNDKSKKANFRTDQGRDRSPRNMFLKFITTQGLSY